MSLCANYPGIETCPEGRSGETAGWLYDACASIKNGNSWGMFWREPGYVPKERGRAFREMRRESKGKKEMRKSQRTNRVATEAAGGCAKLL